MVYMNKNLSKYIRYYLRDNKRLLFLIFIILFVMMPFFTFNASILSVSRDGKQAFSALAGAACVGGCALSFLVPIFNMRFLFNKRSCDLYFSLPIKRKDLFYAQYFSGLLAMLIPLSINYLLGIGVVLLATVLEVGVGASSVYLFTVLLLFYVILVIFLVILYSIFTFISTICNNLIDTILIAGSAVVLPFIIYQALNTFVSNQIGQVLSGISYGGYNEFYDLQIILDLLSAPRVLYLALYQIVESFIIEPTDIMSVTCLTIYWIVVGILAYVFAKKYFIARKQEAAEQRTTHILTYPLVIVSVTLAIILLIMNANMGVVLPVIMTFIVYCCMVFFSKRTIKLKPSNIIAFVILIGISGSLSFIFHETSGFGAIKEFPTVNEIKEAHINVYNHNDDFLLIHRPLGQKGKIAKVSNFRYTTKNKKDFSRFIENQKFASSNRLNNYEYDGSGYSVQMDYELKDGRRFLRSYDLANTKENKKKLEEILLTMVDEGKNVAISFDEEAN